MSFGEIVFAMVMSGIVGLWIYGIIVSDGDTMRRIFWDNTTNDVTIFALAGVSASNPLIRITLYKKGNMVFDEIQNRDCYVYGIWVDGLLFHYTKERLNTPSEFRNTVEQILNAI